MQAQQFRAAEQMARELTKRRVDPNEVSKVLGQLVATSDGPELFAFLRTVVEDGRVVIRSGRTLDYYREIRRVCDKHLRGYRDKPDEMAEILGWAIRLMRYYAVEPGLVQPRPPKPLVKSEEFPTPTPPTERPRRIQDLQVGMVLAGKVRRIMPYGAFVDIGVKRDGLVHISELADRRVGSVEEVVSVGDKVAVRVIKVDLGRNRIGLSMKGMS